MNLPNAQIIPLFGANGAGKSTLIRAIRDSLQAPAKHRAAVQKYQKTWEIEDVEKEIQSGTWKGNTIRNELERIDTLDTLTFEDGKTASHRTWDHFTHGAILHPLFTTYNGSSDFYGYTVRRAFEDASDKVFYRCVDNRTGEKSIRTLEELIPKDRLKKTAP